jgi:SecD/SecF fusion protein
MAKDQIWKIVLILIAVAAATLYMYPPQEKLKLGLDLRGGTSLVYEIDTAGLEPQERRGLAQNMIPILMRRVDPTHVANIVMRPQGDTRIEIQLPMASADTQRRREVYETALLALDDENINLLKIRQSLNLQPTARQQQFETFARGNVERRAALVALAEIFDLRKQAQEQRDMLAGEMAPLRERFTAVGLDYDTLQYSAVQWARQDSEKRRQEVEAYVKTAVQDDIVIADGLSPKQTQARNLIDEYISLYQRWSPIVEELTRPEGGLNARWNKAVAGMSMLNLSVEQVRDVLDMPAASAKRKELLDQLKMQYAGRADKIDAVVSAYDAYKKVGGQLDDPEDLKRMLKGAGVLEFRILPTGEEGNVDELMAYREALTTKGPKQASDSRYLWCEIENPADWPAGLGIVGAFGEKQYVLASHQKNDTMLQTGERAWKLRRAYPTTDEQGRRAIGFAFDDTAANLFFSLTSSSIGKPLCILLDDRAISAPRINSAIRSQGVITGQFSQTEVGDMVNKLNAGSFPARLSEVPISERTIGATMGADNLKKGVTAGLIGLAAVAVFMLIYFMLAGAIADMALVLNVLLVLGVMALLQATFTLPGIAGLILTIGMSVDANVLIFERIREEQKRGSTIRSAIANGYARAFSTIFDANLTTFGVAAILYVAASEEIKGFAIVLMLGILASMFTALFVTRVVFDLLTSSRLLTGPLAMFGLFQNVTVNWMGLQPVFMVVSGVLIVTGLSVFFTRDDRTNSKYDIEFTGGTSVQIDLKEGFGGGREEVQKRFTDYATSIGNMALAGARVNVVGTSGNQYEISTTETNLTTARVTFDAASAPTADSVLDQIRQAADTLGQRLGNLQVKAADAGVFKVSTSRFNVSAVRDVLQTAFGDNATISDLVVHEVVGDAVREAFHDYLAVRENLGIEVVREERILPGSDDAALLSDYLGGVKFVCTLSSSITAHELDARVRDIRFKPDMQDLAWYRYNILSETLSEPAPQERLSRFVYVSVHPEAGYRELDEAEWERFTANEKTKLVSAASLETSLSRVTQIDPSIGSKARNQAMVAILLSLIGIVGYIWVRFGTARFGIAAIVALVHDVCITLGVVTACTYIAGKPLGNALLIGDFKINLEMIAAFLTIIGYSLNDTIVVFDRIRENRGKTTALTGKLISDSINQTLSRTVLTSGTTLLTVLVMYIWGGEGLRGFTFAMLIGIVVGTYSSIAIAAPILLIGAPKEEK